MTDPASASKPTTSSNDTSVAKDNNEKSAEEPADKKRKISLFQPQKNWKLISQGAEARLWKIPASSVDFEIPAAAAAADDDDDSSIPKSIIAKERFSKSYRHPVLDERLTKQRCRAEARILAKCRAANNNNSASSSKDDASSIMSTRVHVPAVLRVDAPVLYIEYIDGKTVRDTLEEVLDFIQEEEKDDDENDKQKQQQKQQQQETVLAYATAMGEMIAHLHNLGIVHGDLTTSNMMMKNANTKAATTATTATTTTTTTTAASSLDLILIDFGLAKNTQSVEERAVDLYVLERALTSTHPRLPNNFWETLMKNYERAAASTTTDKNRNNKTQQTLTRLEQVRQRGRKRECFG